MFGLPRLYVLIAAALVLLGSGFTAGWKVQGWRQAALEHARQTQAQRDAMKRMERVVEAATSHEDFKAKEEVRYVTVTKTITKVVDRPVYLRQCFDDDGRRMLNDYAAGRDSSEPQAAVRAPAKP